MAIMTPEHPLGDEFVTRLTAALDDGEGCDDTDAKPLTRTILAQLAQEFHLAIDVEGSLTFFEQQDGYCDCEVLYHVITKWQLRMEAHWNN